MALLSKIRLAEMPGLLWQGEGSYREVIKGSPPWRHTGWQYLEKGLWSPGQAVSSIWVLACAPGPLVGDDDLSTKLGCPLSFLCAPSCRATSAVCEITHLSNPHSYPVKWVLLLSPILQMRKLRCSVSTVGQLESAEAGFSPGPCGSWSQRCHISRSSTG